MHPQRRYRGFTLVEVLVALFVMALLAAMAWQGVDGIARARSMGNERIERALRLDTVLAQWEQDLAALHDTQPVAPPLAFDGATLRIARRNGGGVQLVAWSLREGRWRRWAGPVVTRTQALQDSWLRSQQLLGNEADQMEMARGVATWQVYFFRNNAWSNAQSSADIVQAPAGAASAPQNQALPTGVRLVIEFDGTAGLAGRLTRDLLIAPQSQ
jgi:general secretion pathway protein J